jgi:hypothetical protein
MQSEVKLETSGSENSSEQAISSERLAKAATIAFVALGGLSISLWNKDLIIDKVNEIFFYCVISIETFLMIAPFFVVNIYEGMNKEKSGALERSNQP